MNGLPGQIAQRGGVPTLVVKINGKEESFAIQLLKPGVYEVVDDRDLVVDGTVVDLVITTNNAVIYYCEAVSPDEVEDVDIESD